jgi:hypothetical protein
MVMMLQAPRIEMDELVRWAEFLSGTDDMPAALHVEAVAALDEAADYDEGLLHDAWLLARRRLTEGDVTREAVRLTHDAFETARVTSGES